MGQLDERRLYSEFGLFPGTGHIGGHLSLALHDKDNIWQAPRFEVSSAGFYASARIGLFQISGRFDMRLPERSLWLTAYLPLGRNEIMQLPDHVLPRLALFDVSVYGID